jgi:long-chain fatty acid transport protein
MSFELDTAYTVWSRWRNLNVDMLNYPNELGGGIHQQKNWRDTWAFSLSGEYWVTDWLALRAGILYETSPLNGVAYQDYFIPTNGRMQYALGTGMKWKDWTLDFAYVYMQERAAELPEHKSPSPLGDVYTSLPGEFGNGYDHTFVLSLSYKF